MRQGWLRYALIGIVLLAAYFGTRAGFRFLVRSAVTKALNGESAVIGDSCPRCRASFTTQPGKEIRCPGCGQRIVACGQCGKLVFGETGWGRDTAGRLLCDADRDESVWQAARLQEFGQAPATTPPPVTPRAHQARAWYDTQLREAEGKDDYLDNSVFTAAREVTPDRAHIPARSLPQTVCAAAAFYDRTVTNQDFGTLGVHQFVVGKQPLYVVRTPTDGSNGWLELYDADGTPLGYARTEMDKPTWAAMGPVRRSVWGEP